METVPPILAKLRRLRAGVALAIVVAAVPIWIVVSRCYPLRRAVERCAWVVLLAGFGIRIRVVGKPRALSDGARGGRLMVSNHVSWADIPVLGLVTRSAFIAKQEVRGWPIIGFLAVRYGCYFIDRGRRARVGEQADGIAARLDTGQGLILFAEGTTGLGDTVLPFRSSLFAGVTDRPIQSIALAWRGRDGAVLSPAELRRIAWIEDDELLPHAMALAASGGALVEVRFGTELSAPDRKALAESSRDAVVAALQAPFV